LVAEKEMSGLAGVFDGDMLLDRICAKMPKMPKDAEKGFRKGAKTGLGSFMSTIASQLNSPCEYELLHVRIVEGEPRAVFRMTGQSGLAYHEFIFIFNFAQERSTPV
jgi:hypothetical protein